MSKIPKRVWMYLLFTIGAFLVKPALPSIGGAAIAISVLEILKLIFDAMEADLRSPTSRGTNPPPDKQRPRPAAPPPPPPIK